ncbi:MAG TPA: alcohol dehydrogenase catalytic domain-containing protein [Phycisphaerae bacterium]|nr:alcohol dehydrogenase catalytic domain-containing protein [Phycisphaerae bacterium]
MTGESMRSLIFEGPGKLSLRFVPRPVPCDGEVLVRVHTAAICGTDVKIVTGRKTREVRRGVPIGHEYTGTVAAIGPGVEGYSIGQRVAVCVVVSCGECVYCQADRENLCETRITLGYATDGCFADYMLIPKRAVRRGNLFALPETVSLEHGPLIEPLACCINGQRELGLPLLDGPARQRGSASLVIFGAGPIGLLHLMLARTYQEPAVRPITVVEPQPHRREFASKLGADRVCSPDEFDAADEYDLAVLAVGVPELVPAALKSVVKCGRISLFAGFPVGSSVSIDPNAIHYKQIRVYGASESRRSDFAEALNLIAAGRLDPSPIITHRFSLEQYEEAFRVAADGSALKVVFTMTALQR